MLIETVDFNADNQGIFDVYLGLIASGYDLANPIRAGAICELVMAENWSQQTLQYFSFAQINDGRINPYCGLVLRFWHLSVYLLISYRWKHTWH